MPKTNDAALDMMEAVLQVADMEVRVVPGGYELWLACTSEGVAVLSVPTEDLGQVICDGDGSLAACPCGNESALGAGEGCLNSSGLGCVLTASGVPSLAADSLVLEASQLTAQPALFFQGDARTNGGAGLPHLAVADGGEFGGNLGGIILCAADLDDAGRFLQAYSEKGIYEKDPFVTLDQEGVGELVKMAAARGRRTRPGIKLGICGEHGGDPASVEFCHRAGLDYVSCSPYRVPIARLAAAQAALKDSSR